MSTLLQPAVIVSWGAYPLTRLFYDASMVFNSKNEGHSATFSFEPSERGYDLYRKCTSKENREKPIVITMGYSNGNSITGEFQYTGVDMVTGTSQTITVKAHSYAIGKLNRYKLNKTYGDGTSELSLKDLLEKESRYRGVVLNTQEFTDRAVNHSTLSGETTAEYVKRELFGLGYTVTLPTSPALAGYDAKVDRPFTEGKVKLAEVTEVEGREERRAYFLSLELMNEFSKGVSYNPPTISTDSLGSSGSESNQELVEEDEDVEEIAPSSVEIDDEVTDSDDKVTSANKEKNVSSSDEKVDDDLTKDAKEEITRQASTSFFLVPRVTGIKPQDFILVPSLKNDYLEDWEISSVTYTQSGTAISVDLQMTRWAKDEPIVKNYSELLTKSQSYSKDWLKYYWQLSA